VLPLTTLSLLRIMPKAEPVVVAWIGELEQAMLAWNIDRGNRIAFFLANIAHESAELTGLEEGFNYRASRLHAMFPLRVKSVKEAQALIDQGPEAVANAMYGGREGNAPDEGYLYRARGPIGITFKNNYRACSLAICGDADTLLLNPELLTTPKYGSLSAAWYWSRAGCNAAADENDFMSACALVNVGHRVTDPSLINGFDVREKYLARALAEA
jgi:putative chitinase